MPRGPGREPRHPGSSVECTSALGYQKASWCGSENGAFFEFFLFHLSFNCNVCFFDFGSLEVSNMWIAFRFRPVKRLVGIFQISSRNIKKRKDNRWWRHFQRAPRCCFVAPSPKKRKRKLQMAKKVKRAKAKGKRRRDPPPLCGWRTGLFTGSDLDGEQWWTPWHLVEIHRSLEDVLLAVDNNLSGIEPGLAAVEFQGAGISHHSPLVKDRMPGIEDGHAEWILSDRTGKHFFEAWWCRGFYVIYCDLSLCILIYFDDMNVSLVKFLFPMRQHQIPSELFSALRKFSSDPAMPWRNAMILRAKPC